MWSPVSQFSARLSPKHAHYISYKETIGFDRRLASSSKIREVHPDRIPVVVEPDRHSELELIAHRKFLVPTDLTVAGLQREIRKHIPYLLPHQAIFLVLSNGTIPQGNLLVCHLDDLYRDTDGFLYLTYTGENTFG